MSVKLLTEHHLEYLSLKEGCTGPSESMLVKMPHCWKSHVTAQLFSLFCRSSFQGIRLSCLSLKGDFKEHVEKHGRIQKNRQGGEF